MKRHFYAIHQNLKLNSYIKRNNNVLCSNFIVSGLNYDKALVFLGKHRYLLACGSEIINVYLLKPVLYHTLISAISTNCIRQNRYLHNFQSSVRFGHFFAEAKRKGFTPYFDLLTKISLNKSLKGSVRLPTIAQLR